jgi:predicted negative regulator of RcsB-dependent stress response
MQTQDTPAEFLFRLWPKLEQNKKPIIGGAVAILLLAAIAYFISAQHAQKEIDAGEAVSAVIVNSAASSNPSQTASSMEVLAAKYSGTAAGARAEVQAAGALFEAGNYADAQTQFQKYLDDNASGPLAATAQLGVAASLEAQNKIDQAVAAYQKVISGYAASSCVGPAEYALARICEQQNKLSEAMTHYENVIRSTLPGTLNNEAKSRAYELQAKVAASSPKPMTTIKPVVTNSATIKP